MILVNITKTGLPGVMWTTTTKADIFKITICYCGIKLKIIRIKKMICKN